MPTIVAFDRRSAVSARSKCSDWASIPNCASNGRSDSPYPKRSTANAVRLACASTGPTSRNKKLQVPKPCIRRIGEPPCPYRSTCIDPGPTGIRRRSASIEAGNCTGGVCTGVQLAQPGYHCSIFRPRAMWPADASIGVAGAMTEQEQTYDDGRARNLEALLRALADRIRELDGQGKLLDQAGELMRLIGDVRSELFHYEVRITYDTPEVAENRRIVREAEEKSTDSWQTSEWKPDEDESPEW